MHKRFILIISFTLIACYTGNLKTITNLPKQLNEVSGTQILMQLDLIWMLNDGGNVAKLYGVNEKGIIVKKLKIYAENNDWEDLVLDQESHLYIDDFGNNYSKIKNLAVLKISYDSFNNTAETDVEYIFFQL